MAEARISVRVAPRSARNEILYRDGALTVRVTAPAVDGQANGALCRVLAGQLGLRPSAVRIVRGERARQKLVAIEGLDDSEVAARLPSG